MLSHGFGRISNLRRQDPREYFEQLSPSKRHGECRTPVGHYSVQKNLTDPHQSVRAEHVNDVTSWYIHFLFLNPATLLIFYENASYVERPC